MKYIQRYWVKIWCGSCIRWEGDSGIDNSHVDLNAAYQWAHQHAGANITCMVVEDPLAYHSPPARE